jgi:dnd system-associated protein 4
MKNLRISIEKDKHEIYERLTKRGNENPDDYPFQTMKHLFMVAACLGAKRNAYKDVTSGRDIFGTDVFDEKVDLPVISALAFKHEKNLSVLNDDRKMLNIAEGYANGGITLIQQEIINSPGRPLDNLISLLIQEAE